MFLYFKKLESRRITEKIRFFTLVYCTFSIQYIVEGFGKKSKKVFIFFTGGLTHFFGTSRILQVSILKEFF